MTAGSPAAAPATRISFHLPPRDLQSCFTTFYLTEIDLPDTATVTDALQPEWANLRFFSGAPPRSWIAGNEPLTDTNFVATGPSSRATSFCLGRSRFWGIGLLPLGWARFIGLPAEDHANLVTDGHRHPSFARFRPLAETLATHAGDEEAELAAIAAFFAAFPPLDPEEEARINAISAVLVDPRTATVAEMVERLAINQRTLERTCLRHFGFPPKLLLNRQRFMRSLVQFMLDRSRKWIGAIDRQLSRSSAVRARLSPVHGDEPQPVCRHAAPGAGAVHARTGAVARGRRPDAACAGTGNDPERISRFGFDPAGKAAKGAASDKGQGSTSGLRSYPRSGAGAHQRRAGS
jgi:hypothetical protein